MSASNRARTAVTLPSASAAMSMCWIIPRPWMVAWALGDDAPPAGLDRRWDEGLLHVALGHRVGGCGERLVDCSRVGDELPRVAGVGAQLLVHERAVGEGVLEVDDGWKHVVLDDD